MPMRSRLAESAAAAGAKARVSSVASRPTSSCRRWQNSEVKDMENSSLQRIEGRGDGSVAMLTGDTGVKLRGNLFPAAVDQCLLTQVLRRAEVAAWVEPDVRLWLVGNEPHQERTGCVRLLAQAQIGRSLQQMPDMPATADRTGVAGERRKTLLGQLFWQRQAPGLFAQQADFIQGDPQVGVDALFTGAQVTSSVDLVLSDAVGLLAFAVPGNHRSGSGQHQQAEKQHGEGFVASACRSDDLSGRAHGHLP